MEVTVSAFVCKYVYRDWVIPPLNVQTESIIIFKVKFLKALFNNVSTLKFSAAWPYMLSVSLIRCKN